MVSRPRTVCVNVTCLLCRWRCYRNARITARRNGVMHIPRVLPLRPIFARLYANSLFIPDWHRPERVCLKCRQHFLNCRENMFMTTYTWPLYWSKEIFKNVLLKCNSLFDLAFIQNLLFPSYYATDVFFLSRQRSNSFLMAV